MKEDYCTNQISSALTKPHNQDLADEFYERSVTGFERAEDYSQLDKLQRDRMDLEQQAVDDLLIDKNFKGPNSFWNRIQKLSQTYHTQVAALDSVMNLFEKMPSIEDYETEAEFKEALKIIDLKNHYQQLDMIIIKYMMMLLMILAKLIGIKLIIKYEDMKKKFGQKNKQNILIFK